MALNTKMDRAVATVGVRSDQGGGSCDPMIVPVIPVDDEESPVDYVTDGWFRFKPGLLDAKGEWDTIETSTQSIAVAQSQLAEATEEANKPDVAFGEKRAEVSAKVQTAKGDAETAKTALDTADDAVLEADQNLDNLSDEAAKLMEDLEAVNADWEDHSDAYYGTPGGEGEGEGTLGSRPALEQEWDNKIGEKVEDQQEELGKLRADIAKERDEVLQPFNDQVADATGQLGVAHLRPLVKWLNQKLSPCCKALVRFTVIWVS